MSRYKIFPANTDNRHPSSEPAESLLESSGCWSLSQVMMQAQTRT